MLRLWVLLGCVAAVAPSFAHDFWSNRVVVDPVTKWLCCNKSDHFVLTANEVHKTEDGFLVTGHFQTPEGDFDINRIIHPERIMPSPDGYFHVFIIDYDVRCFFAPVLY
jgi:hypothetical protein